MFKKMTWKQRVEYFMDYYLFRTVCIMVLAAVCLLLVWHFLVRDSNVSLYVAVLNESLDTEATEKLQEDIKENFGLEGEVIVDDRFYLEGDGLSKLEIYMKNEQIDILIAGVEDYVQICGYGFAKELRQMFDEDFIQEHEEQVISAAGYRDTDEISFEDHETGQGEVKEYGFQAAEKERYRQFCNVQQNSVIGIAETTGRQDLAGECVAWLLEKE